MTHRTPLVFFHVLLNAHHARPPAMAGKVRPTGDDYPKKGDRLWVLLSDNGAEVQWYACTSEGFNNEVGLFTVRMHNAYDSQPADTIMAHDLAKFHWARIAPSDVLHNQPPPIPDEWKGTTGQEGTSGETGMSGAKRKQTELSALAFVFGISETALEDSSIVATEDSSIVATEFSAIMADESAHAAIREFVFAHGLSDLKAFFDGNPGRTALGRNESIGVLRVWYELGDERRLLNNRKWNANEVQKRWKSLESVKRQRKGEKKGKKRDLPIAQPDPTREPRQRRGSAVAQQINAVTASDAKVEIVVCRPQIVWGAHARVVFEDVHYWESKRGDIQVSEGLSVTATKDAIQVPPAPPSVLPIPPPSPPPFPPPTLPLLAATPLHIVPISPAGCA